MAYDHFHGKLSLFPLGNAHQAANLTSRMKAYPWGCCMSQRCRPLSPWLQEGLHRAYLAQLSAGISWRCPAELLGQSLVVAGCLHRQDGLW